MMHSMKKKTRAPSSQPDRHAGIKISFYVPPAQLKRLDAYRAKLRHPASRGQVLRDAIDALLGS